MRVSCLLGHLLEPGHCCPRTLQCCHWHHETEHPSDDDAEEPVVPWNQHLGTWDQRRKAGRVPCSAAGEARNPPRESMRSPESSLEASHPLTAGYTSEHRGPVGATSGAAQEGAKR
ncbi:hypothetical protein NDU88_003705 [Pleurodeles waltl]|uniref:Uncharacterized protein n=1 Tax=Pleurodeles waltl TaxID=8319 RepID=A0AAV7M7X1_PLEWA|nr:hypothetical protein NDU88_003705 [Pleurodeles waltl]